MKVTAWLPRLPIGTNLMLGRATFVVFDASCRDSGTYQWAPERKHPVSCPSLQWIPASGGSGTGYCTVTQLHRALWGLTMDVPEDLADGSRRAYLDTVVQPHSPAYSSTAHTHACFLGLQIT